MNNNTWKNNSLHTDINSEKKIHRESPNTDEMQMVMIDDNTRIYISKNASAEDARSNFLAKQSMKRNKLGLKN